jgi:hypothetical protein
MTDMTFFVDELAASVEALPRESVGSQAITIAAVALPKRGIAVR